THQAYFSASRSAAMMRSISARMKACTSVSDTLVPGSPLSPFGPGGPAGPAGPVAAGGIGVSGIVRVSVSVSTSAGQGVPLLLAGVVMLRVRWRSRRSSVVLTAFHALHAPHALHS